MRRGPSGAELIRLNSSAGLQGEHERALCELGQEPLTALSRLLKYAVDLEVLDRAPRMRLVKRPPSEVEFHDFGHYLRLTEAARALDPRVELLVLLGGDAGLRPGEAIALEWSDVDVGRGTIHVQRSEWDGSVTPPKGGRSRRVPLTAALLHALKEHRHLPGSRVLYKDDGTTVGKKAVKGWMEKAQRRAGLPVTGAYHILRHTFCSHLAMQGAPAKAIQELAGHADLTTTLRYMHSSPAVRDAAVTLLNRRPVEVPGEERGTSRGRRRKVERGQLVG